MMSLKQNLAELWLLKQHKHGESLLGLTPRPHECLNPNSIPHEQRRSMTLFPPTHLIVCEIEGDRRDCCGAICVEGAGEYSVDVARARLRDRRSCAPAEGVEGVKLTAAAVIFPLATLQANRRTKLRSWRASARSRHMMPPQHQRAHPPVFPKHLQLPP
jgi:hypothetical protein